jgi:hypothetical protein
MSKFNRYILSILYFIPLYIFWIGAFPVIIGIRQSGINYAGGAFAFGIIFPYIIANIYEKNGKSWWKIFLMSGFLSTGMPVIGIIWLIILKVKKGGVKEDNKIKFSEKIEGVINMENGFIDNINYKDILIRNDMEEYITLFENNRLSDLSIIMDLTENDYEKLGIEFMGDRKRLLKIFSKNEIDNYKNNIIAENQNKNDIEKPIENNNIPEGETNIIIKRNCATASMVRMDIKIDDKYLNLYNDSSESIILNNGSHTIMASFRYDCQSEIFNFIAIGKDIVFNIIPKNINEIIIERIE